MSRKSTADRYGSVAIAIHWSSALAVVLAFIAGLAAANTEPTPVLLLVAHIILGVTVFALTAFRIVWWLVADRQPAAPADHPRWQVRAAQVVHLGVYVALVVMAVTGIGTVIASNAFGAIAAGTVPDFSGLPPRMAHGVMSRLLLLLLVLHIGAALYHQFIRRDGLLARMGAGRR